MKEKIDHHLHFYKHEPRETLIFDENVNIMIKYQKIASWIVTIEKQLIKLNLETQVEP
jgi:hypothetical protein